MSNSLNTHTIATNLRRCFLNLPQTDSAIKRMRQLAAYSCNGEEPEHLLLVGDSGTGKSTLLKKFISAYPRVEHLEFTEVPVLYTEVPSKISIKSLAGLMLLNLGSEYWSRGDEVDRTYQLVQLIRACKCRIIILDEVNHLVDRGGAKTNYAIGDWIKQLGTSANTSIVLAGTLRAKQLLWTNAQLASRYGEILTISPLSMENGRAAEFMGALQSLESLISPLSSLRLCDEINAQKIAFATGGRLRSIRKLLVRAVEIAGAQPRPKLDLGVLSLAFEQVIFAQAGPDRNPFSQKFNGLPLIGLGEPFAPEELAYAHR